MAVTWAGRAHQAPEVDGATEVRSDRPLVAGRPGQCRLSPDSDGVDLTADADVWRGRQAADSR